MTNNTILNHKALILATLLLVSPLTQAWDIRVSGGYGTHHTDGHHPYQGHGSYGQDSYQPHSYGYGSDDHHAYGHGDDPHSTGAYGYGGRVRIGAGDHRGKVHIGSGNRLHQRVYPRGDQHGYQPHYQPQHNQAYTHSTDRRTHRLRTIRRETPHHTIKPHGYYKHGRTGAHHYYQPNLRHGLGGHRQSFGGRQSRSR